jgi:hypothetical protein
MRIYQEKIAPPANPPSDEEQMRLIAESLARDDRWVKNIVDGLAGILRDVKHWSKAASVGDLFHIKLKHASGSRALRRLCWRLRRKQNEDIGFAADRSLEHRLRENVQSLLRVSWIAFAARRSASEGQWIARP